MTMSETASTRNNSDSNSMEVSVTTDELTSEIEQVTSTIDLVIDPRLMFMLKILIYYALQLPVLALGMGTNCLVMLTFIRSGLTDSVTVSFLALSISDFGYCTFFFMARLAAVLPVMTKTSFYVRVDLLAYVLTFYSMFFNDASVLITVFTAVQKCCCVAIPHLFKNVFTPKRAIFIIIVINCALLCLYVPLNQSFRLEPTFFESINRTVVYLHLGPLYFKFLPAWRIFSRISLPLVAQGIVLLCLFFMAYKLKQSAKFRSVSANQQDSSHTTKKTTESYRLGPKETRALEAVTVVSAIFIAATLVSTIIFYAHLAFPVLLQPRLKPVRSLLHNSHNIFIHINATVNLFVYLKYNTKFKTSFRDFVGCLAVKESKGSE